jgi:ligand-binding sensor domain-containing protein
MYKDGEHFLATDVSLGFFHLPQVEGAILSACRAGTGPRVLVGTSRGDLAGFDGKNLFYRRTLEGRPRITALAFSDAADELWVGTDSKGLFRLRGVTGGAPVLTAGSNRLPSGAILDIEIDAAGHVWCAVQGHGLARRSRPEDGPWKIYLPGDSEVLYRSVGEILAHPKRGVWYLPHSTVTSRGLGHFDGQRGRVLNPPHAVLRSPSSMVFDGDGDIWIGTWFDGLYEIELEDQEGGCL